MEMMDYVMMFFIVTAASAAGSFVHGFFKAVWVEYEAMKRADAVESSSLSEQIPEITRGQDFVNVVPIDDKTKR